MESGAKTPTNRILPGDYWTSQRRELIRWFDDRAPSFTEGYIGAVRLLHDPSFEARVHFICHIVRDIYQYLPAALGEKTGSRPAEVFPEMAKKLAERWKKSSPRLLEEQYEGDPTYAFNSLVFRYLEKIVSKSWSMAQKPSFGASLALVLYQSVDRPEQDYIPEWVIASFNVEHKFFVKRAHLATEAKSVPDDEGLIDHFEAFERAFHSLIGPYFSGKEELDAILQDTNEQAD